jgi:hypothetical protein
MKYRTSLLAAVLVLATAPPQVSIAQTTAPAQTAPAPAPSPFYGMYIYPNNNQSAAQQTTDETACFNWAKKKTGVDPATLAQMTAPSPAASASTTQAQSLKGFKYNFKQCMNKRGYAVKQNPS